MEYSEQELNVLKNQLTKIRILDIVVMTTINYGMDCGIVTLQDTVDLSCGAVPQGSFEEVIDLGAAEQYLSMYTQMVEKRFACVVTEMKRINPLYMEQIKNICKSVGGNIVNIEGNMNAINAYSVYDQLVLDGMPGEQNREIIEAKEECVVWKKLSDSHKAAWDKFSGDVNDYYELMSVFVNAIMKEHGITFTNEKNEQFSLTK